MMRSKPGISKRPYFFVLLTLLLLFCVRVSSQLLVVFLHPSFLPPMADWYSGLISYPFLVVFQFMIILLFGKICVDFAGLGGRFSIPDRVLARRLCRFGILYLSAMLFRYSLLLYSHPGEIWVRGCIPTFFHWVLASFILVFAEYHHRASAAAEAANTEFDRMLKQSSGDECLILSSEISSRSQERSSKVLAP